MATNSNALLITNDKDFGDLVFLKRAETSGVMLCRLGSLDLEDEARQVLEAVIREGEALLGCLSVLSPQKSRIRPTDGEVADRKE